MKEVAKFTQPDVSPDYFIEFLEYLDRFDEVKRIRAEFSKRLDVQPGCKVLDLGCGIGGATIPLAEEVGPQGFVAGVDISHAMIERAKRNAGAGANARAALEFHVADARSVPYPDDFFDAARSERVFLYLPDRVAVIREMMRVVKPGGRICLADTDMDSTAIYSKNHALTRKMTSLVAATMTNPNSARDLLPLARQAGLKNVKAETFATSTPHEFFLRVMAGALAKAVEDGAASADEVEQFLSEQASLAASGDFFQSWLYVIVSGTV
jgi:ubiquinone/menaquinone biosynthesis C-methylase UbiE